MENEKPFEINIGEDKFELTRYNSVLIRHLGQLAINDYVQLRTEQGSGYIFADNEGFELVAEYMEENNYMQLLNLNEVDDDIAEAHAKIIRGNSDSDIDEELEKWQRLFKNENGHE